VLHTTFTFTALTCTQQSSLPELQQLHANLVSDKAKFDDLIVRLRDHMAALEQRLEKYRGDERDRTTDVATAREEQARLQAVVAGQELSVQDVQTMNMERRRLREELSRAASRKEEAQQAIWDLEMSIARRLQDLESQLATYHSRATELALLPVGAKNAGDMQFEVTLQPHAPITESLFTVDMRSIKAALREMTEQYTRRASEASATELELATEVQGLSDTLMEARASAASVEARTERQRTLFRDGKAVRVCVEPGGV
jgi:SMC interacting uncharacterized protein involved in chromosome segregation